ncbi:MAG TPA: hypothetical protein VF398_10465 [bacterium]
MKLAVLTFAALMALAAQAQDTLQPAAPPHVPLMASPGGRALQSAALPGLGQALRGEWIRGGLYFAGAAFLAGDALHFWENQYNRPASEDAGRIYDRDMAYGLAVWYGMAAVLSAADAGYATSKKREIKPTLAAFKSIFFPGWGQLSNGKRWKAAGMFLLQTGFAFGAFTQHERFLFYDALGDVDKASFYKSDRNRLVWWSAGIALFSAFDAFVDCHLRDWNVSEKLSIYPHYAPESKSAGISLRLSLN